MRTLRLPEANSPANGTHQKQRLNRQNRQQITEGNREQRGHQRAANAAPAVRLRKSNLIIPPRLPRCALPRVATDRPLSPAAVADTAPRFRYNLRMPRADQPKEEPSSAVSPAVEAFIARWSPSGGGEHSNYQLFLSELCDVLGVPKPEPAVADVARNAYIFDRSIPHQEPDGSTTTNFIDLYKRGCFICETKQGVEAAANRDADLPSPSPLGGESVAEGRVRGSSVRRGHGIRGGNAAGRLSLRF